MDVESRRGRVLELIFPCFEFESSVHGIEKAWKRDPLCPEFKRPRAGAGEGGNGAEDGEFGEEV